MDNMIEVVAPDGRRLHVSEKAYRTIYQDEGYRPYVAPKPARKPWAKKAD